MDDKDLTSNQPESEAHEYVIMKVENGKVVQRVTLSYGPGVPVTIDMVMRDGKNYLEQLVDDYIKSGRIPSEEGYQLFVAPSDMIEAPPDQPDTPIQSTTEATEPAPPPPEQDHKKRRTKNPAADTGALTEVSNRQIIITDKKYKHALSAKENDAAFISMLTEDFMSSLHFDPVTGQLELIGNQRTIVKKATGNGLKNVAYLDLPLLRQIFTACFVTYTRFDRNTIDVFLPSFCKEMGIDIHHDAPTKLFDKLSSFKNCVGVLNNGSYYKLFDLLGYNKDTNVLTFAAPFFLQLIAKIDDKNTITKRNGDTYKKPSYCKLIHSNIVSCRNKAAIEIVNRILTMLQERGTVTDANRKENEANKDDFEPGVITCGIKFCSIVDDIPILQERLAKSTKANKNVQLKRAFSAAYDMLRTKTDAYLYYKDLVIPETIPTISTLNQKLTITHRGRNRGYTEQNG